MIDLSKDGLLKNKNNHNIFHNIKNNNRLSFESISEKQDESSDSTLRKTKLKETTIKNNRKTSFKFEIPKDRSVGGNTSNTSLKGIKLSKSTSKKGILLQKRKTVKNFNIKEEENEKENIIHTNSSNFVSKRISLQQDNFHTFYNHLKSVEDFKKKSFKMIPSNNINANKTIIKEKRSLNITMNNNFKERTLSGFYGKNTIIQKSLKKNQSKILTNSDIIYMKYFNNKK